MTFKSPIIVLVALAVGSTAAHAASDLSCKRAPALCERLSTAISSALGLPLEATLTLRSLRYPRRAGVVVSDATLLDIHVPKRAPSTTLVAKLTVLGAGDDAPQEIWARVDADITVPTLVVVSALPRGASVTNADITQVMRPWVAGKLHRPAEALGRVTRRALRAGDTLEAGILTLPNVVRRGQRVTAIVSGASFRIRTAAEVLEPGPIGATIAVRVSVSGKRLQARVVGPDMVEVLQ